MRPESHSGNEHPGIGVHTSPVPPLLPTERRKSLQIAVFRFSTPVGEFQSDGAESHFTRLTFAGWRAPRSAAGAGWRFGLGAGDSASRLTDA